MSTAEWDTLEAVLQNLSPVEKLELIERLARSLHAAPLPVSPASRQEALHALRRELRALPVENPADGFSNRDHDRVLYGESS
jgi:hypothetical protein